MSKSNASKKFIEFAGKSIAGKTTQKSGLKLVQFAAAQAWERKQWKQAFELYSDIPPANRSLAVWDRLGQLSKKIGKEFDRQGFVQAVLRQQSIEDLVSALDVAKKLGDAELKGVLTDEIRLYLAKTGGYSPKLFKLLHAKDPAWRRLEVFSGITPSDETRPLTILQHMKLFPKSIFTLQVWRNSSRHEPNWMRNFIFTGKPKNPTLNSPFWNSVGIELATRSG